VPGSADPCPTSTVVKLGGSVITRKQREERLRPKVLARLAEEIVAAETPMILLHGAGSFGHPGAVRFGLARAPATDAGPHARSRGAAIVATEVRRLHLAVLQALVRAGGRPESIPVSTHARNQGGRLAGFDPAPFRTALSAGRLPVSFGDVVPDGAWGSSILSADTIALALARELPVTRVLFVSDVPGVFDPARPSDHIVLPIVEAGLASRLSARTAGVDVTGGIQGKVSAMLEIAAGGVDAGLISGLSDGNLLRALRGERVHGSWAIAAP
jgi:isopentenyl phosphate kinase